MSNIDKISITLDEVFPDLPPETSLEKLQIRLVVWWCNEVKGFLRQRATEYLRKRGYVVFYLDEQNRHCSGVCWLECYKNAGDV